MQESVLLVALDVLQCIYALWLLQSPEHGLLTAPRGTREKCHRLIVSRGSGSHDTQNKTAAPQSALEKVAHTTPGRGVEVISERRSAQVFFLIILFMPYNLKKTPILRGWEKSAVGTLPLRPSGCLYSQIFIHFLLSCYSKLLLA